MAAELQERPALCVFARLPRPGLVKTRLAASVGPDAAALFYRSCAERVIAELGRMHNTQVYLFFSRGEDAAQVAAWLAPLGVEGMALVPQLPHSDLGARMAHAMAHAFAAGHRRVAIVGTDVPDLTAAVVERALSALDRHQAVFGPAEDGGYYLLALSELPEGLFNGITWSTPTVLAANMANAQRLGLSVAPLGTLPRLPDIDTAEDLRHWCQAAQRRAEQRAEQQREDLQLPPEAGGQRQQQQQQQQQQSPEQARQVPAAEAAGQPEQSLDPLIAVALQVLSTPAIS